MAFSLRPGGWNRPFARVLQAGDRVAGRYRVIKAVAAGGMGRIYQAKDEEAGRLVALKILSVPSADDVLIERFQREARLLESLAGAHVVRAFDHGQTEAGQFYVVLEWLEGEDLEHKLTREGPLGLDDVFEIARGALRGLHSIHREGVVHRDVKPGNIFLSGDELPPSSVKLLDFGVAKITEEAVVGGTDTPLTLAGMILGTPFYMSPEQAQGRERIDGRADLFSLAAVLYECLSGRRPFEASSAMTLLVRIASEAPKPILEIDPSLPEVLESFFDTALGRRPEDRFQSAIEMEEAIDSIAGGTVEMPIPFSVDLREGQLVTERMDATPISSVETDVVDVPTQRLDSRHGLDDFPTRPSIDREPPVPTFRTSAADDSSSSRDLRIVTVLVGDLSAVGARRRLVWALFSKAVTDNGEALPVRGGLAIGVFGAQKTFGDEPQRALRVALRTLGLDHQSATDPGSIHELRLAIGTGTVVRDSLTSVRGEAVESACDLLAFAGPGELVSDGATLEEADLNLDTQSRGPSAYLVRGTTGDSGPARPRRGPLPFVGRTEDVRRLADVFDECRESRRPHAVVITAHAGGGKTRLREEVRREILRRAPGVNIIVGQATPTTQSTPLGVFADALRRRGAIHGDEEVGTLVAKLGRLVPRRVEPMSRDQAMSGLARLVGVNVPEPYAPTEPGPAADGDIADRVAGRRTRTALLDVLRGYCEEGPVALFLEDLQWSDPASLDVLDEILQDDLPLFVLALARDDADTEALSQLLTLEELGGDRMEHQALEALELDEIRPIVEHMLGEQVGDSLVRAVYQRTGGNPYLIEQTLRAIAREDEEHAPTPETLDRRLSLVPRSVHALIQSRLDALSVEGRELLRRAAVVGATFWDDAIRALGVEEAAALLDHLVAEDYIEPSATSRFTPHREYSFRSSLVRDVVYESLSETTRKELHRVVADWLGSVGEADPVVLASHLVPGGERARAAIALLEAARQALSSGDAKAAQALAERGLSIAEASELAIVTSDLLVALQRSSEQLGDYEQALTQLTRIEKLPTGSELSAWIAFRRGQLFRLRGNAHRAVEQLKKARIQYDRVERPIDAARAILALGGAFADRGDIVPAVEQYQDAYARAQSLGDLPLVTRSLLGLARVAYSTSDLGQAIRMAQEAEHNLTHFIDDLEMKAEAAKALGTAWLAAGDVDKAIEYLERAKACFEDLPSAVDARLCEAFLARADLERSPQSEGTRLEAAFEQASASESKEDLFVAGLYLARYHLDLGDHREAQELAQSLRDQAVRSLARFVVPLESALGLARARAGDPEDGLRYTMSAVHRLESKRACEDEDPQRIYAQHAEALGLSGRDEECQKAWRRARKTMEEVGSRLAESQRSRYSRRAVNRRIADRSN